MEKKLLKKFQYAKGVQQNMKVKFKIMCCTTIDNIRHLSLEEKKGTFKKVSGWKFFLYKGQKGYSMIDPKTGVSLISPQKNKEEAINQTKKVLLKYVSIIDTTSYLNLCEKYKKMKKYVQLEFDF